MLSPPTMTEPSRIQQAIERCAEALFTGKLRVHARQADGEVWFLSGIVERVRFGASTGDDASQRMLTSEVTRLDARPCLPNLDGGFDKGHATDGALGEIRPMDLLRFCETHALTCKVELASQGVRGGFEYRLGELVTVSCEAGGDGAVTKMLEWQSGTFRFNLPRVDLVLEQNDSPPSIPPPSMPKPEADDALERAAASARMRIAADEARKRRAEEIERKRQAEEAARKRQAEELERQARVAIEAEKARKNHEPPPSLPVPLPPKSRRSPADRAPNRAQRRAELRQRGEIGPESGGSVSVRLIRVTTETITVSVPVTSAVTREANGEGDPRVDPEKLFAEATRIAARPGARWQREGEPRVAPHPQQPPLLQTGDLIRRG
jgi:hypothetical protein